ncbi:MAG: ribonuclease P protein component [Candidatus Desulfofervidus auxilii]|nr:ribonuclease P protein component [Candidatus Desulfofervidus auxilii]
MKLFGFSKRERIRRQKEFLAVLKKGKKWQTSHFVIFLKPNTQSCTRLGIRVGRDVGKAVKRNRIKRLIREFFRLHKYELPVGHDVVIMVKKDATSLSYHQVCKELSQVLCQRKR